MSGEGADHGMPSPQSASLQGDSDSLSPRILGKVERRRAGSERSCEELRKERDGRLRGWTSQARKGGNQ